MARKNSTFKHNFVIGAGTALGAAMVMLGVYVGYEAFKKVKTKVSGPTVQSMPGGASYQSMPGASYQQNAQGQYY